MMLMAKPFFLWSCALLAVAALSLFVGYEWASSRLPEFQLRRGDNRAFDEESTGVMRDSRNLSPSIKDATVDKSRVSSVGGSETSAARPTDRDVVRILMALKDGKAADFERVIGRRLDAAELLALQAAIKTAFAVKDEMSRQLTLEARRLVSVFVAGNPHGWKVTRDEPSVSQGGWRAAWASDGYVEAVEGGRVLGVMTSRSSAPYLWGLIDGYRLFNRKLYESLSAAVKN
ncbi:MAG: hypothetical protein H6832_09935 [Planctomycetes bacterium]|nr:hypothetical protein [Planctomycetota bacterium]MCB9891854.1 hypothetical protein [Planctomycetota bacterium]MCB9918710.1 hypothetical protein [Planctomycetota bacterium]